MLSLSSNGRRNRGRKGTRGRKASSSNHVRVVNSSFFPPYSSIPSLTRKFRFTERTSGNRIITRGDLLGLYSFLYFDNTSGTNVWQSLIAGIKVMMVSIYSAGNPASTGGNLAWTPIALTWLSENSPEKQILATGNADHPAVIKSTPPPNTLCSFWSGAGFTGDFSPSDPLFSMLLNQGDVIDIVVQYTPSVSPGAVTGTYTNGTVDQPAYGFLDGPGGNLVPEGNVNTYS